MHAVRRYCTSTPSGLWSPVSLEANRPMYEKPMRRASPQAVRRERGKPPVRQAPVSNSWQRNPSSRLSRCSLSTSLTRAESRPSSTVLRSPPRDFSRRYSDRLRFSHTRAPPRRDVELWRFTRNGGRSLDLREQPARREWRTRSGSRRRAPPLCSRALRGRIPRPRTGSRQRFANPPTSSLFPRRHRGLQVSPRSPGRVRQCGAEWRRLRSAGRFRAYAEWQGTT